MLRTRWIMLTGLTALAVAVASVTATVAGRPAMSAAGAAVAPVKIMPLGDSITGSPGCWRALLWNRLQAAGFLNIDFVGTLPPQGCGVTYDGDNEGHGGYLAFFFVVLFLLFGWFVVVFFVCLFVAQQLAQLLEDDREQPAQVHACASCACPNVALTKTSSRFGAATTTLASMPASR